MEFEDDESEELIVPFVPWFCYHRFPEELENRVKIIFEKVVKISLLFLQSLKHLPISPQIDHHGSVLEGTVFQKFPLV